jgi:hypothetical protein
MAQFQGLDLTFLVGMQEERRGKHTRQSFNLEVQCTCGLVAKHILHEAALSFSSSASHLGLHKTKQIP